MGHSMGGAIASKFALSYPWLIKSLVLVTPAGLYQHLSIPLYVQIRIPLLTDLALRYVFPRILYERTPLGFEGNPEDYSSALSVMSKNRLYQLSHNPDYLPCMFSCLQDFPFLDFFPIYEFLGKLDFPIHVIWGMMDKTTPPNVELLRKFIPRAGVSIIAKLGHSLPNQSPHIPVEVVKRYAFEKVDGKNFGK
eukprot:TRINITY_DN5496_c0_g1_i4.p1 TRINITY_DN5496_c0_g1~~TRINITY_DN5496_c0_g1_i4.p1  ORF type:complete len:193 (-),score=33.57 TRINITY_DN5496_c0_g1_i4:73-651(-)